MAAAAQTRETLHLRTTATETTNEVSFAFTNGNNLIECRALFFVSILTRVRSLNLLVFYALLFAGAISYNTGWGDSQPASESVVIVYECGPTIKANL